MGEQPDRHDSGRTLAEQQANMGLSASVSFILDDLIQQADWSRVQLEAAAATFNRNTTLTELIVAAEKVLAADRAVMRYQSEPALYLTRTEVVEVQEPEDRHADPL